ncbi:MAG: RNA polymerase sigma-70 factor ECF subfamily [Stygiobacter sp.]|nr:MAG: RNA polymerase sigma-70 factor ECF subfamily [Stygiobacter sp.]KAF0217540.1 MAG: RNA polymerase sigma-70 factor ECF [Ignavibacteria bacterium]
MNSKIIAEEELFRLIKNAVEGDLSAFEAILKNHQYYAYTVAFRVLTNDDDAKDVVQESFVRIWKHLGSYSKKAKFTTWIYKIVINLCYDKLRARKTENERLETIDDGFVSGLDNPEKQLTNKEQAEIIKHVSNGLPEKQRMVFVLRDLEELTTDEVSQIMDISIESVKTNLSIARKTIRTKLIKWRVTNEL